ncbi:CDP-diacylglycerol--glycerol-3-phosphate 3-phosphatidyltransferase [Phocoenobacter skyensis]|uniref:CDP-diacylglycerol--glycerol-3-phosphate 3-phosphatidyltransferase n=1 Tax=Phocoenobacter skyensis TaxID=97481 RepID=A0A1H7VZH9_9PAST|nr:CDP-diacylglycerol--glycerol-3-phosphate 3-phosphatidyltransferase [Pasteurella skyensis]MDP8079062.1 CDP-diacylglycerol--glycerol-3-phosphate 3-phosphatidyltransferase [Pasteurella skyensis]MDP8085012.1 CDP-diacylglycerol--glycerol-3-phosphate 3-phosphatidyltransferase [Pasteurella skyensis]MDP8161920.1 CDP-diacylglycerol--glycerol-3-phosphate 3-phosphatidyltransferase [Pasteurella skyensis]MDP8170659.1 CDP-diacylglycerol--glycerol-3-phosphate 3-phosphatidyltransferase [Pasteurella skyensis
MKLNLPTYLTFFRVILIPLFIIAFYLPFKYAPELSALLFFIAALTDWFDGYLARKWNQVTRLGAFLDPVADKVLVAAALVCVVEHYHTWWVTIPATIMIAREIIISALREWMAEIGERANVAVSWLGKVKTTAQMVALVGLLWRVNFAAEVAAFIALYIAAILTIWSMLQYLKASKNSLINNN